MKKEITNQKNVKKIHFFHDTTYEMLNFLLRFPNKKTGRQNIPWSLYNDGNSEHVEHAWSKIGLLGFKKKHNFMTTVDQIKYPNRSNNWYRSLLAHLFQSYHLIQVPWVPFQVFLYVNLAIFMYLYYYTNSGLSGL